MENRIREILSEHNPEKARCVDGYWTCPACGHDYGVFAPEVVEDEKDEFSHVSALLAELITEYQAKAWDKGFDRGSRAYSGIKRLYVPAGPTKGNRNPYRHKLEDADG